MSRRSADAPVPVSLTLGPDDIKGRVYFLSDLHLGASYSPGAREAEMRVVRFLESISGDAGALYLMGDILDYWFEYRTVVPRGYVRFFGALARLADAGVRIYWFIGNHDIWLFDYLRSELGIEVIDGVAVHSILGRKFFLNHGDGVGHLDPGFRFIRALFRNRLCQKLYAGVHPRWTIPFAHGWSRHSRCSSGGEAPQFQGIDREPVAIFARDYVRRVDPDIDFFVFGHLHVLVDEPVAPGCRLIVLGDWIRLFSYGVFDGNQFELKLFAD